MGKHFTHLLDASSAVTFIYGFIASQDFLMIMGGFASLMAAANHSYDLYRKYKGHKGKK